MPKSKPQLVALLMCDQAFQQVGNGKWCVIGVFDTLNSHQIPFTLPQLMVYVSLSDFAGDAMVELVIRDEEGAVVKAVRGKIPPIPMGLFQYVFPFPEVEFKKPGVHTLELFADGDLITLRSFRVQSTAPDPEKEEAEATALLELHGRKLVSDAREVLSEHPEARPVGVIASVGAASAPWFRQAFASVFGADPPQAIFAGIVDPGTLTRLLGALGQDVEAALRPPFGEGDGMLPVAIVTRGGCKFAFQPFGDG